MSGSPYASSLGRLKADGTAFLTRATLEGLMRSTGLGEFTKQLATTPYGYDLEQARAAYQGIALVEAAINRTLVRRNRHAYEATPFAGRLVVATDLRRWDIENITAILASKAQRRTLSVGETELVSSREIPAGLFAGAMTLDDFRALLQQPTVDAIANELVRFGYGGTLLPLMEEYQRTHDIFPLLHALQVQYYRSVLEAARFFQGDEWVVRELVRGEIDARNVLVLLKGKDGELSTEEVLTRWIDGGAIPASEVTDLYSARTVPELVERLAPRFPALSEGNEAYAESRSLGTYDIALQRARARAEVHRLASYPMSLGGVFTYLLLAEVERADLRRIAFGLLYAVPTERLASLVASPRE